MESDCADQSSCFVASNLSSNYRACWGGAGVYLCLGLGVPEHHDVACLSAPALQKREQSAIELYIQHCSVV